MRDPVQADDAPADLGPAASAVRDDGGAAAAGDGGAIRRVPLARGRRGVRAQSIVSGGAGQDFQNYDTELQKLEKSSRVTPAEFATLVSDAEQLAQSIETSNLTPAAVTEQLDELQDTVDQSFVAASYTSSGWSQMQTQLDDALYDTNISTDLPGETYSQMQLIARAAHVTKAEYKTLVADQQAINAALGPQVNTNLGGSSPRDPLVVYYNGQVNQFVHKR